MKLFQDGVKDTSFGKTSASSKKRRPMTRPPGRVKLLSAIIEKRRSRFNTAVLQ